MATQRLIPFKIESMDSLGQGVSKETDKITFISKTLPGETGHARVVAAKKGIQFATLEKLTHKSTKRIDPSCPHFAHCPSCHYLHTEYEEELRFKKSNMERMFYKIPHPEIIVTPGVRRTHYRNRIQLHYDKKKKLLGMLDAKNHTIAPTPQCIIGVDPVKDELTRLYQNDAWLDLVKEHPPQGHIEIYQHQGQVKVSLNRPYAEGGFTQVFEEMNQVLKQKLVDHFAPLASMELLDLFAGNGNLSDKLNYSRRLCVDYYSQKIADPFYSQDLYVEQALKNVTSKLKEMKLDPQVILIDPPRSGLKNLQQWLGQFRPQFVAYVSCDPHTLVRDLKEVTDYQITGVHLLDFFPSTFHFESLVFLERNQS